MKKDSLVIGFIVALAVFWAPGFVDADELIPPSRTLESAELAPGELSLFSEPPGLEIFINNESAGVTPARRILLEPGAHSLAIEGTEFQFQIESSERLQFSFFNGRLIKNPPPEPPPLIETQAADESRPRPSAAPPPRKKKTASGLSSWDLFINGSSRHF